MNTCTRCKEVFEGRYPQSKICKRCSRRGMPRGRDHWNYQTGLHTYHTVAHEIKTEIVNCERCHKSLVYATRREWVIHHRDHDQYNNDRLNLELLCKRCHQIEHDCVSNFEGATTISKESTLK